MTPSMFLAFWAIVSVGLFGAAAMLWIRRKAAEMRGRRLPGLRLL